MMRILQLIREWIVDDWRRKVAALFFATIIWAAVTLQIQDVETIRNVPVQISCPPDVEITNADDLPTVTVTVRGSKRALQSVNSNSIIIRHTIDVTRERINETYDAKIRPSDIDLPPGLRIDSIDPQSIPVHLDAKVIANVPIHVRFSGQPPSGMDIKSVICTPSTVRISGPGRTVADIHEIATEPIKLDDDIPFSFTTDASLINPYRDQVSLAITEVTVSVDMMRATDEKYFADIPVNVIDVTNSTLYVEKYIDPPKPRVSLVVEGPKTVIDYLPPSSIRAFVDISDIREPEIRTLPIQVYVLNEECKPRRNSFSPLQLKVQIARRPAAPAEEQP